MEQPDGYTGYEEYDQYYGNPYENTSTPKHVEDEDVPVVAGISDAHRINIIEMSDQESHDQFYSPRTHTGYDRVTLKAYAPDPNRVSIHPLGVTECPPGVRSTEWRLLDTDKLLATAAISAASNAGTENTVKKSPALVGAGGNDNIPPAEKAPEEPGKKDPSEMPFLDHLEEFRWSLLKSIFTIVIAMIAAWFLADQFYATITRLAKAADLPLIFTQLMEPIMIRLQMTFVMGIVISLPFVFYFLWSFVAPGLYDNEKKWVLPLALGATIFFFIGASVAYFVIIPFMLTFIKDFMPEDIQPMITIGDFISKLLKFTLLFGVMFELPLVSFFLAKLGILKHTWMIQYRKFAIVVIFVLGAVLTPPDPMSQIIMAAPLIILYEVSILVARFGGRKTVLAI